MSSSNQMVDKPDLLVCPERTSTNTSKTTSSTEGHTSLEMNVPEEPARRGSWLFGRLSAAPVPLSAPATPPPELEEGPDNQTMTGIGCLFSQLLPSRPPSLTLGSESNTDAPSTPSQASDANDSHDQEKTHRSSEDSLETPRATTSSHTPTVTLSMQALLFGQVPPLTPDTPIRTGSKRAPGSPCAPRPKKARRSMGVDVEDEGYSEAQYQEPATGQSLQHIQQLTIDLVDSTRVAIDPGNTPIAETKTNTQAELQLGSHSSCQAISTEHSANPSFALAIEWFSEDEILEQLSVFLVAYRAFHLEPDAAEQPRVRDPEAAQMAKQTFEAIFHPKLNSEDDKKFLLQEEEEDVLAVFAIWVRDMKASSDVDCEPFENVADCMQRVADLSAAPFIRRLVAFGEPLDIDLAVREISGTLMPTYQDDGIIEWEFDMFSRDFEQLSIK
ncbi:Putative protein of unknown function [Podospora comata]|uniref:Uncharacterized protein n=1 Tax=Podospora comata TaxID=48703 RepID=A0ABY6RVG7_PODCO|nr:Putative protein of unknown function [Podospora comata]